jgi:hypothetical protein
MLWLIGLALLAAYYVGPTEFSIVAVISLLLVGLSVIATVVGLRTVRDHELV